jgi:protein-S-isoprenylcysteine O-methyltransferase Ste14
MTRPPWWKGARGEWYMVGQFGLGALVVFGPRRIAGWPAADLPWPWACQDAGAAFIVAGSLLFAAGVARLGSNLSPFPRPLAGATLVETGAYRIVRHPLYSGLLAAGLGWAVFVRSWLTLLYVGLSFAWLDLKARREERWLVERFPQYRDYQRRVRRLVPFLY